MKTYEGTRLPDSCWVTVNGERLPARFDLANHSPSGFDWGHLGGGPAQLALAILADHLNDDDEALRLYQQFKNQVIGQLSFDGWKMNTMDVDAALAQLNEDVSAHTSTSDFFD